MSTLTANGNNISLIFRPPLGFISVDIHFHRPPGDAYNEHTWPFPLIREQAEGSTEKQIVTNKKYDAEFIDRFVDAGMRLARRGAVGILTSCGFLAMAQSELAARLPIPVATSALIQIPSVLAILPPTKSIAVITYDETRLNEQHLQQLGISSIDPATGQKKIHIRGAPADGHLRKVIQENAPYVHADIETELVQVAKSAVEEHGNGEGAVGAVVLECTQMPCFADAIQNAVGTGIPVYDVYTMGCWFYEGLVRRRPATWDALSVI